MANVSGHVSRPIAETDGRRRVNWRGPKHSWLPTGDPVGFLACRFCGIQHTIGDRIGKNTLTYYYKYPGQTEWTRYNRRSKEKGAERIPPCRRDPGDTR